MIAKKPITKDEKSNTLISDFPLTSGAMYLLKWSVSIMVAELLILVEIVLIPAAKIEAISRPVIPTGKPLTMK
jgi:hypothetical protein